MNKIFYHLNCKNQRFTVKTRLGETYSCIVSSRLDYCNVLLTGLSKRALIVLCSRLCTGSCGSENRLNHRSKTYSDLATISSQEDITQLTRPSSYNGSAWIGLHDDPASWNRVMSEDSNSWRWTATGTTSPGAYQIWKQAEPNFLAAQQSCGNFSSIREWPLSKPRLYCDF
uniref:C-type lectin domain-containing protein n=1 Tax=Periophthalmus magnuspinnatus TaxID=409849 RepID=A0A3B4BDU5_9GOBI